MISSIIQAFFQPDYDGSSARHHGPSKRSPVPSNPPPLGSEWQRLAPQVLAVFCFLTAVYSSVYYTFQNSETILGFPAPAPEFCANHDSSNGNVCSRSDLFAFQVASGLAFLIMGGFGFFYWHIKGVHLTSVPQTAAGRCFGYIPEAEFVAVVCFTFQVWDFIISLGIPEHRTPIMLMHHTLAAAVSLAGLHCQYLLWYSFYFFGLSEVSSIFLVFMDLSKFFPPQSETAFGAFIEGYCGPMFAVTFLFYRGFMWWRITYLKFKDCRSILRSGQAEKLRPGKTWVLYVLMGFNIPMGMLQIYWSSLILTEIKKIVTGEA
eukprot:CAMPEP_0172450294 /NCGR_PEP_ID=MMETSP1065-20121228/8696_1 /TAXON_ID=265537 /ORGANISM="Amphiprora paludosa, Strain CCMP125" /LENGTH=318 /DNA_ID=CAMNT_0013202073 /DNA_START=86 /DNA_END=1042 /DNA_ORIENTATION=+